MEERTPGKLRAFADRATKTAATAALAVWASITASRTELIALAGGWQVSEGAATVHPAGGPLVRGVLLIVLAVCIARSRAVG
ncbi:hypothetical protein NLX83_13080 [Allokutzneria sp. A3M-2-11 16]|uniref:hypothetical protein n=1 Tax=Allokutzneria sp. A3M-2-11 16 TaxID=2962043 RepID=UPI0020B817EC|nr:hypothetical protein [Allokutzneria sp. A3M-2-11 16]MCP3800192.1 hypothetical protein [Allokutzneria sp. A3M-2-11 16]